MPDIKRLAIVTTHPVQYYAPLFKLLYERQKIQIKVFYTWGQAAAQKFDPGFKKSIEWDLPLLNGYDFEWVENISTDPGSHHRKGIINPSLINQINLFKPDAVLFFGWAYVGHLKAMCHFKEKVPVYFRGDSTLLDEKNDVKTFLKKLYLKWVYKHVDHAFYVGTNNKAYFKEYGLKDDQLNFAPHAIDNDRFSHDRSSEVSELKDRLGINNNDIVILFAGKFESKKSPLLLLEAFDKVKHDNAHLIFVGNGELENELKRAAKALKNIHFLAFQNQTQMPVIYQTCDIFCLPSAGPGESWGLAVNEAMACGKTIVVSDKVGCAVDLVENGINGYIFNSGEIDSITSSLKNLLSSKSSLRAYGKKSFDRIQNWNFVAVAEALESHLK